MAILALDQAMATAAPERKAALDAQAELEAGWGRLSVAYAQALYALEKDAETVLLPGWTESEFQQLQIGTKVEL
jgi:hypothetical protein